jgi:hypothetical protein
MFLYKSKNLRDAFDDKTRNFGSLACRIPSMTSLSEMVGTFVVWKSTFRNSTDEETLKVATKGFCNKLWVCNIVITRLIQVTV